jgi:hypothetical protein
LMASSSSARPRIPSRRRSRSTRANADPTISPHVLVPRPPNFHIAMEVRPACSRYLREECPPSYVISK